MTNHSFKYSFEIPELVSIIKQENFLKIVGPLGQSYINLKKIDPKGLGALVVDETRKKVTIMSPSKSFFGLFKKLIENKIQGVTRGFIIYLKILGIGYRATLTESKLSLKLGYSHDIIYQVPESIKIFLLDSTVICLFGIDKNQLTQIAAKIRNLRPPSAYKGKGIRLSTQKIILKQGKKK